MTTSTGIILAGGQSSRMGTDKAQLPWNTSTMVDHLIDVIGSVTDEVIVVVADADAPVTDRARHVIDIHTGIGPVAGLHAGLTAATYDRVFVCSCDMPLLRPTLVVGLLERLQNHDAVIPVTPDGVQPLCAAYSTATLPQITNQIDTGTHSMRQVATALNDVLLIEDPELRHIDPQLLSFANLNTPSEYQQAQQLRAEPT